MDALPLYNKNICFFHRINHGPTVKMERHHHLIFAGSQVNALFCILLLCKDIHDKVFQPHIKERLDWIMTNRMSPEEIRHYSKVRRFQWERDRLNHLFGGPWIPPV